MISEADLFVAGLTIARAHEWAPFLNAAAEKYEITTPRRIAMFLAQCGHESDDFIHLVENLNYSAGALMRTWPKRFPTKAVADAYARQPEKIANKVYANRMGNRDELSGDGWKYRGHGPIQLTGHDNLAACGRGIGADLVADPSLLTTPRWGALSAGWFWSTRKLNVPSDASDVAAATRKINGGENGLSDRLTRFDRILKALNAKVETRPSQTPSVED